MKPYWADEAIYKLFNEFLEKSILADNSFLTNETGVITIAVLDDCINRFIVEVIEGKDSFDNKIVQQFEGAKYETILTFAHVNWLWCMAPSDFKTSTKESVPANILGKNKRVDIRTDIYPEGGFGNAGPSIKFRKHREISFLLLLMKQLKLKVIDGSISNIEQANNSIDHKMKIKMKLKKHLDIEEIKQLLEYVDNALDCLMDVRNELDKVVATKKTPVK